MNDDLTIFNALTSRCRSVKCLHQVTSFKMQVHITMTMQGKDCILTLKVTMADIPLKKASLSTQHIRKQESKEGISLELG